jgi:ABC-type cobalt transport system substrate-binding protein
MKKKPDDGEIETLLFIIEQHCQFAVRNYF